MCYPFCTLHFTMGPAPILPQFTGVGGQWKLGPTPSRWDQGPQPHSSEVPTFRPGDTHASDDSRSTQDPHEKDSESPGFLTQAVWEAPTQLATLLPSSGPADCTSVP